jgi:2-hydroxychromene-2-carboxylate isomerase
MPITVDYYITLNSPFTYLGCALLAEIAQRNNATVNIKPHFRTDRRAAAAEALAATPRVPNDGAETLGRGARNSVNA